MPSFNGFFFFAILVLAAMWVGIFYMTGVVLGWIS